MKFQSPPLPQFVVATRRKPSCSSSENWSRVVPGTAPIDTSGTPAAARTSAARVDAGIEVHLARVQRHRQRVAQQIPQPLGFAGAGFEYGRIVVDGADVLVDQLPHRPAVARPVGTGLRRLQAVAHVAELAGQGRHAIGEGRQQGFRVCGVREQLLQAEPVATAGHRAGTVAARTDQRQRSRLGAGGGAGIAAVRHAGCPGRGKGW